MRTAALILTCLLAGCAAQAAGTGSRVDLQALVKVHPLYPALAQYDRQIAALRATLHAPEFARKSAAFMNAQRAAAAQLDDAAARSRAIASEAPPDVRDLSEESHASAPSEATVRSDMQRTYIAQAGAFRADAQRAMDAFRQSMFVQENAALANYVRATRARVEQAYTSRRAELYEKESTLALELARADAGKRLPIMAKLQTLALRAPVRHALQAELDTIQKQEDARVAAQRARDRAQLSALLPALQRKAAADVARMRAELQSRTSATIAARARVLAAQNATRSTLPFGGNTNAPSAPGDMQAQLNALLRAPAADPGAFDAAKGELQAQFAGVRSADDAATQNTWAQIGTLEKAREQLYNGIVSQIERDAERLAREHPGADVTQLVRTDLSGLSRENAVSRNHP